jgi:hypothetical protein
MSGLNDGNLTANTSVYSSGDIDNGYEAAGIVFSSAKTISSVSFINGSITNGDGYLEAGLCLEISYDGTTWTSATPKGWTINTVYPYNSTAAGKTYTFSGPAISSVKGVRVCGQVVVVQESYYWRLKEVMVYGH